MTIPGGARPKDWDVAWSWGGKYRLVISLKSILRNLGGTVPNRIDDVMGETANIQLYSPEVVVGYVLVIDRSQDRVDASGRGWGGVMRERLARLSGRRAPYWTPGTFEGHALLEVDFSSSARLVSGAADLERMLDELAAEVKRRNPGAAGGSGHA